jgi:drug/metabolite transporter (DMT)-like permease
MPPMPTYLLFAACTAIWGTTWIAITFQTSAAAPELAVALRFALAAAITLLLCRLRGIALPTSAAAHGWLALMGTLGFCASYFFVYYAQAYIVSGLIAVGYSAVPLLNMALSRLFLGTPLSPRIGLAGVLGISGIVMIFWPEIGRTQAGSPLAIGAAFTAAGVVASCLANIVVARNQRLGLKGWAPLGLGMAYGAALGWLYVLMAGVPLGIRWSLPFAASLVYLTLAGSVLAFAAYYALVGRVGAARAGYVGVSSTLVALVVSSLFEGYRWAPLTVLGVAAAVAGAVLIIQPARTTASAVRAGS